MKLSDLAPIVCEEIEKEGLRKIDFGDGNEIAKCPYQRMWERLFIKYGKIDILWKEWMETCQED